MKRRDFIKYTAAASAVAAGAAQGFRLGGMPVYAQSPPMLGGNVLESDKILIIVQLFGGNDALNTIVPLNDDNYHNLRPTIRVRPEDNPAQIAGSEAYFHPALVDSFDGGFLKLHDEGRLAVIQGIGYEHPNLSHFRSTDIWLSGYNPRDEDIFSDPQVRLLDGWVGRFFAHSLPTFPNDLPSYPLAIQIGGQLSLMLQSDAGDAGIAITDPERFFSQDGGLSADETALPGIDAYEKEYNYILQVAQASDRYKDEVKAAYEGGKTTIQYGEGLPQQFGTVARMISGGLGTKVYLLRMGGFDNHVNQAFEGQTGLHPALLQQLSMGISQFMADAVNQGFADRVVGMTVTEFGRRPRENGSRGTDHGTTSVQFVFGERVRAGLYGDNPDLDRFLKDSDRNSNLDYQNDYRRVYAEILEVLFGAEKSDVEAILGKQFVHMGILDPAISSVDSPFVNQLSGGALRLSPNPSGGNVQASFELKRPTMVDLSLYTIQGVHEMRIRRGMFNRGVHSVNFDAPNGGVWLCVLEAEGRQIAEKLVVLR